MNFVCSFCDNLRMLKNNKICIFHKKSIYFMYNVEKKITIIIIYIYILFLCKAKGVHLLKKMYFYSIEGRYIYEKG